VFPSFVANEDRPLLLPWPHAEGRLPVRASDAVYGFSPRQHRLHSRYQSGQRVSMDFIAMHDKKTIVESAI